MVDKNRKRNETNDPELKKKRINSAKSFVKQILREYNEYCRCYNKEPEIYLSIEEAWFCFADGEDNITDRYYAKERRYILKSMVKAEFKKLGFVSEDVEELPQKKEKSA